MSDALVALLAVLIIGCPLVTWRVGWAFVQAARPKPRDEFLTVLAIALVGVALASGLFGLLGIHGLIFTASAGAVRVLPQGAFILVLAGGMLVIAILEIPLYRWLGRLRIQRQAAHIHRRSEHEPPRFHRRATDTPHPDEVELERPVDAVGSEGSH